MAIDLFRIFRSCFLCKGTKNLERVEHPGYNTTFHYFHPDCLDTVLRNPEEHIDFLDTAIQISDQQTVDRQGELRQIELKNDLISKARQITGEALVEERKKANFLK